MIDWKNNNNGKSTNLHLFPSEVNILSLFLELNINLFESPHKLVPNTGKGGGNYEDNFAPRHRFTEYNLMVGARTLMCLVLW